MQYFKNDRQKIKTIIAGAKNFLLLTHVNPDGDAIGSVFGLGFILRKMKKNAFIGFPVPMPSRFDFFNMDEGIKMVLPEKISISRVDCVFVLDCSSKQRTGTCMQVLEKLGEDIPVINIDHHPDNSKFGTMNIIDSDASSTSQMIVELMGVRAMDRRAAFCLYAGMVSDTGSFRHGKNMKRVHEAVIACLGYSVSTKDVYDRLFAIETEASLKLFARALSTLVLDDKKATVAYMMLNYEDYDELKVPVEASGGFINRMLMLEDAQIVVFFNETEQNRISVSFRSNINFNVGELAQKYGGGGHEKASGCEIEGSLPKVIDRVMKSLYLALGDEKFS